MTPTRKSLRLGRFRAVARDILIGDREARRLRMAADYGRLDFLRVLRSHPAEAVLDSDAVILGGDRGLIGPTMPASPVEAAAGTGPPDPGTPDPGTTP